jgi:hypothetical protein
MVLPAGVHVATFLEVQATFATNNRRRELFNGLIDAAVSLFNAGCGLLYLDGSYVTEKPMPADYDACWDPTGVDPKRLDPIFMDFTNKRQAQKSKFKGEFFPSTLGNTSSQPFLGFFQTDRFTGQRKGILSIFLSTELTLTKRIQP